MKSSKHILILTPGFPSDEKDSTCIPALQEFVRALKENSNDFQISIITLQYPFTNKPYWWKGIQVYPCGGKNRKRLMRIKTWLFAYCNYKKITKTKKIDIIHSFWLTESALLGNFFSSKKKIRHICTLLGQDAKVENKYHRIINFRKLKLVFPSSFCMETFCKHTVYPNPSIIPLGVDLKEFNSNKNNVRSIDILGVGSLIPLKRFDEFINTIAQLKTNYPTIKAVLIGDGIEKEKLIRQIEQLGLMENITLTGSISRSEVLQYMSKSRILLHPSEFETFGAVFAEATNSRMGIVSRKVGIAEESKFWLFANNTEEFVKQTEILLNQPSNFDLKDSYDIQDTVKAYITLYNKMI